MTPREAVDVTRQHAAGGITMEMWKVVVDDEDRRRGRLAGEICTFCGRPPAGRRVPHGVRELPERAVLLAPLALSKDRLASSRAALQDG